MNNTGVQFTKETKNVVNLTNEIVTPFKNVVVIGKPICNYMA
jgi:hypothetical protein